MDETYERLLCILYDCSVRHVPRKRAAHKKIIPRDRLMLMRKRIRLHRHARLATGPLSCHLQDQIDIINRKLKEFVDAETECNERRAVEAVKAIPKYFYSYAKKYSKTVSTVGPLVKGDALVSEPKDMAEEMNRCYREVYTIPRFTDVSDAVERYTGPDRNKIISNVELSETTVKSSLSMLNDSSAAEPDGVPAVS